MSSDSHFLQYLLQSGKISPQQAQQIIVSQVKAPQQKFDTLLLSQNLLSNEALHHSRDEFSTIRSYVPNYTAIDRKNLPPAIGVYRIQGLLGEGGFGLVLWGLNPEGSEVAIKVLRSFSEC